MIRLAILAVVLALTAQAAMADAHLIGLTGKGSKPAEYGYTIRTVESGKKVEICLELTPDAAKAFGQGELALTKGDKTIVEAMVTIAKDGKGKGTLKLTLDRLAVDGGELLIWSAPIKDAPTTINFGGFRLSIADLLAGDDEDPADAVMKAMDGFRKQLPEPVGLNEMNSHGVPPTPVLLPSWTCLTGFRLSG
jgi:hypothetical protein